MKTRSYWWQGLRYASMSICSIYAGYIIQAKEIKEFKDLISGDLVVLIIPVLASIWFFMCYAQRFDPENSKTFDNETEASEWLRAALMTLIIAAFLAPLSLMLGSYLLDKTFPVPLIIAFVIQAGMYAYYGYFLINRLHKDSNRVLRHRLFWSVILSIGFSLYYGYTFSQLAISWLPLLPVGGITILYVIDRLSDRERRIFVKGMSIIFLILMILVILANTNIIFVPYGLAENAITMLICVAISIYMAVFEAWVVTSQVASNFPSPLKAGEAPLPFVNQKRFQYSAGTLSFLILIIWIFPILFIFSPYGGYFLVGFSIHALLSFLLWYKFGRGKHLKHFRWGYIKSAMVLTFLVFLVSTKVFDKPPSGRFYINFVDFTPAFGFGVMAFFPIKNLLSREYRRKENPLQILTERINFARLLSAISFITYLGLCLTLTFLTSDKDSTKYYKSEMILCFYGVCIMLCAAMELCHNIPLFIKPLFNRMARAVWKFFVGLLMVARVVPSALLGLAVFLPSIYNGIGFWQSCFSSLPFFLSAIGAFALNDYYDIEKDKINKPYRAIPSGKLPANLVLLFSVVSIALGLLTTFIFSRTKIEFILYIICISGMTSYNFFVKYLSLSKTFLTATISSLPLLFSVIVFEYPTVYLLLPIAACSFILGREWLMDIRDVKGDTKGQIVTIPMIIGPAATTKLGFGLQFVAALLLLPIAFYNFSYWSLSLVAVIFLSTIALYVLWSTESGRFQPRVIRLLWIPMFCGLLFFIK